MAATYSIAVIGDWESVMGFRALGLDTYPVTSVEEARKTVHDLAKTGLRGDLPDRDRWPRIWPTCWTVIRTISSPPLS